MNPSVPCMIVDAIESAHQHRRLAVLIHPMLLDSMPAVVVPNGPSLYPLCVAVIADTPIYVDEGQFPGCFTVIPATELIEHTRRIAINNALKERGEMHRTHS
jgi:hypothetical protein